MNNVYTRYFELKNDKKLPISGRFIDPYDNTPYLITKKDTLEDIIHKVTEDRKTKNIPPISPSVLKPLVVMSLAETCSDRDLRDCFVPVAHAPKFAQVLSFIKALATETTSKNNVSIKQRKERASKCQGCFFHKARAQGPTLINKIPLESLKNSLSYEEEEKLGVCGLCGCPMQAKVKFDLMSVLAGLVPEQLDLGLTTLGPKAFDTCWIFGESLQNPNTSKLLRNKVQRASNKALAVFDYYINLQASKLKAKNND